MKKKTREFQLRDSGSVETMIYEYNTRACDEFIYGEKKGSIMNAEAEVRRQKEREREKERRDRRSFRLLFIHEIFFYYYLFFTSMLYVKLLVSPCISF